MAPPATLAVVGEIVTVTPVGVGVLFLPHPVQTSAIRTTNRSKCFRETFVAISAMMYEVESGS